MTLRMPLLLFLCALAVPPPASAGICSVRMLALTDVCWECAFPIMPVEPYGCLCPAPPPQFVRGGIVWAFWEPVWAVDVTLTPFCFPSLGMKIDPGFDAAAGTLAADPNRNKRAFYQAHVYENFLWTASIGKANEAACKLWYSGGGNYTVEWLTEFDPLWADDELAFILGPEAALFANPVAQAACAADCVAATAGLPLDLLFWCAGCQGSLYPMGGSLSEHTGGIFASETLAERLVAKLHRQMLAWDTTSYECGNQPMPLIRKSQYRTQIIYPIPRSSTPAFGASEIPTAVGQEWPYVGEDFAYLIWRKRRCCVSN